MRASSVVALVLLCVAGLPGRAGATMEQLTPQASLEQNQYDYAARQALVDERRREGDYASAYWHAAWLAWLASRQYVDSAEGVSFLRDRANRDRAGWGARANLAPVLAAADAQRLLYNSCLDGTIAQQAGRLRREIADLLARAEESESRAGRSDPVARMALVALGLTLDDAIALDAAHDSAPRVAALRRAATRAETVAAWLPKAPGPHRALAIIRARLAEIQGRVELREMAISEAERAYQLDSADPGLPELLWTLHLRAGHWAEAAAWQAKVGGGAVRMSR